MARMTEEEAEGVFHTSRTAPMYVLHNLDPCKNLDIIAEVLILNFLQ